ncbi:MAG: 3-deoxy-manno-octulosonate cytidylyltransferase [Holosporaceae bacterium]|jgi:3-deoxy-manno-octulosonate cytidylyltransferase (CMP-KDO synthetase)|nr:3-deoxy-manno-octulosonate cytidylyltransferase [Holosporaceae bacterium]
MSDTLIVIPARIASTRLRGKMLANVGGKPLVIRTLESAIAADVGDVVVACDGLEIADAVRNVGGKAVLTHPDLPSGSDRVFAAWAKCDPGGKYRLVINFQGDLPFVSPNFIRTACRAIKEISCDIFTLAVPIRDNSHLRNSVIKPIISFLDNRERIGRAIYFSRSPVPSGGPFFNHVGIYCFWKESLRKFVQLRSSPLERSEKLEQLRAIENGMTIGIAVVDDEPPISVDTEDDLVEARNYAAAYDKTAPNNFFTK